MLPQQSDSVCTCDRSAAYNCGRAQRAEAENERLRKAVEHYADESNWINGQEYKTFPGFHGAAVARSALVAKTGNQQQGDGA